MTPDELAYCTLTGYVTKTYSTTWHDAQGNLWRKTCTVVNLGRPDRNIQPDPDAMIETDETHVFDEAEAERLSIGYEATQRRRARMNVVLQAYLAEHGPTSTQELLPLTVWADIETLRLHMQSQPDKYVRLHDRPAIYGLPGQTLKGGVVGRAPVHFVLRRLLTEHGALDVAQLTQLSGLRDSTISTALRRFEGVHFVSVAQRKASNGKMAAVWDLAGNGHGND